MRRALVALVVTVVAVVLVAGYSTHPPRTFNPNSALRENAVRRAIVQPLPTPAPSSTPPPDTARRKTREGPLLASPFSIIQVRATLTDGKLTGVETVYLTGDGPHTNALNARAEPILRAEALRAGSADIDIVSGATATSRSWIDSLQEAIEDARG
jgi:uncharacterized protein with FMN-binding domain